MKTRLIAAIALALAATTATVAKKLEVKVTGSNHEFVRGYWVEYEINGIKYRSDWAGGKAPDAAALPARRLSDIRKSPIRQRGGFRPFESPQSPSGKTFEKQS